MYTLIKKYTFSILLLLTCCFAFFYGSLAAHAETNDRGLKTTILIYSGKPDPHYTIIDSNKINHLKNLLSKVSENDKFNRKKRVIPSILGYKGIVIINAGDIMDFPRYIAIYNGNIEVRNKETVFLIDKERTIERYLLDLAVEKKALDKRYYKNILETQ